MRRRHVPPAAAPRWGISKPVMKALGVLGGIAAAITRRDRLLNPTTVRLMHIMAPMDHSKAVRELGWQPRDVHESILEAAEFFDFFGQRRRDRDGFARDH